MPTTTDRVRIHLGHAPGVMDDDALDEAVAASNAWVASVRRDLPSLLGEDGKPLDPELITWPAFADFAATLEAAWLYGRRGSVQGVAAFADAGVALVPTIDPGARFLLSLGTYQRSVVA